LLNNKIYAVGGFDGQTGRFSNGLADRNIFWIFYINY
jgi:hypothetical protein